MCLLSMSLVERAFETTQAETQTDVLNVFVVVSKTHIFLKWVFWGNKIFGEDPHRSFFLFLSGFA